MSVVVDFSCDSTEYLMTDYFRKYINIQTSLFYMSLLNSLSEISTVRNIIQIQNHISITAGQMTGLKMDLLSRTNDKEENCEKLAEIMDTENDDKTVLESELFYVLFI